MKFVKYSINGTFKTNIDKIEVKTKEVMAAKRKISYEEKKENS